MNPDGHNALLQNAQEVTSETNEVGINSFAESFLTENMTFMEKGTTNQSVHPASSNLVSKKPFNLKQLIAKSNDSTVMRNANLLQDVQQACMNHGLLSDTQDSVEILKRKKPFKLKGTADGHLLAADADIVMRTHNQSESVQLSSFAHNHPEAHSLEQSSFSANNQKLDPRNMSVFDGKNQSIENN